MMNPRRQIIEHDAARPSKLDWCGQACDLVTILGVDICKHGVVALQVRCDQHKLAALRSKLSLTGGISFGRSTSFVMVFSPINGHSSSTAFFICSQRSAFWLIRRIKPYLTVRRRYAPSSTFSVKLPLALMVSFLPLRGELANQVGILNAPDSELTVEEDLGLSRRYRWWGWSHRSYHRIRVGCHQALWGFHQELVGRYRKRKGSWMWQEKKGRAAEEK